MTYLRRLVAEVWDALLIPRRIDVVIEALNNLSGAIDSLLELLQLDVSEC